MKLKLIILPFLGLVAIGSWVMANDPMAGGGDWHGHHSSLERITEQLNLTPDQRAKIQPVLDQARPQLEAIHREAMEKARKVTEDAMVQIRPMLTPDQLKRLDDAKLERDHGPRHHRPGDAGPDDPND